MKGIKNLGLYKKLTAALLAGSMAFTLASCSGKVNMKSLSPKELLSISDIKDLTLLDELIEFGNVQLDDGMDVVSAAEKLERSLNIIDNLSKVDFSGVSLLSPLTEDQCSAALALSDADIETLKEECNYNGKDLARLERKLEALKMLSYLKSSCLDWVHENGQYVSINYMMSAVKGAVAAELGVSLDDYFSVKIDSRPKATETEIDYTITVGEKTYKVSSSAGELWNTINYIYSVQEASLTSKTEFDTYRKSLNYGKTTMAAGVNLKNGKFVEQNDESYIRKNYVKH